MPDIASQAIDLLALEQYAAVVDLCTQTIAANPDLLTAYWYLGLAYLLQGEEAEAQATWILVLADAEPQSTDAAIDELLGILLSEAKRLGGKPHLQEYIYKQVLEISAEPSEIYLALGKVIAVQGRLDEAIDLWQQAVQARPSWADPYEELGEVWQKVGQIAEAIEAYSQAVQLRSQWKTHYNLGLCLSQVGRWQEASDQFRRTLDLKPDFAPAWGDLGGALLQQGQWQDAIDCLIAAVCHHSTFAQQYCAWATALTSAQQPQLNAQFLHLLQTQASAAEILQSLQTLFSASRVSASPPPCIPLYSSASPEGYYETTQDWATATQAPGYKTLDPSSLLPLIPPKSVDCSIHFSFRFGTNVPLPGAFVVEIPEGQFWLNADESSCAVLTAEQQLLGDLSPEFPLLSPGHPDKHPSQHSLFQQEILPPAYQMEGTIAVLAGLMNGMYFHWMFDVLPRLDLLRRSGIDFNKIDGFVVSHHLPFQRETLQLLGIPASKILEPQLCSRIQASQLIVPSFPAVPAWMPKWACEFLRSTFLRSNVREGGRRLYVSRHLTANRRIINEAEIIDFLSELGFQIVTLESLSVLEQAALLADAKVVISPHGGGLTNLVFCSPGTKVIEIFSPKFVYPCYWLVSNLVNLEYYYLLGKIPEGEYLHQLLYSNPRLEDIFVDLGELKQLLHQADVM
ncbi:MAG TPA: glycosyltransferase 61 family protein [Trichocoleus sp.]